MSEPVHYTICPFCACSMRPSSDKEFFRCVHCGVVRTKYSYDSKMYDPKYTKNYLGYAKTEINTPLNLFRLGLVSRWVRPGQTILDVGCCIGEFLRFTEKHYPCIGFEPNKDAAKTARSRCDSAVYTELNGSIPKVQAVTLFDVLEHMEDPQGFLEMVKDQYLQDKGVIVITTPNVDVIPKWPGSEDDMKAWKHYKPTEHLWLFTEEALSHMGVNASLNPIHFGREESDIRPGNPGGGILTCVLQRA